MKWADRPHCPLEKQGFGPAPAFPGPADLTRAFSLLSDAGHAQPLIISSFPTDRKCETLSRRSVLAEVEKKAKLRQTRVWPRVSSFLGVGGGVFLVLFFWGVVGVC